MRKAGIQDYESFARDILREVKHKPISFEVFSDEFPEMKRQALKIRDWQENVFVKIPITNSRGESSIPLITDLSTASVQLNITAILTLKQVREVASVLNPAVPAVVSSDAQASSRGRFSSQSSCAGSGLGFCRSHCRYRQRSGSDHEGE
jgi:transaldolase